MLPLFAASTPAANDGKWYFVKSQRFGSGGPWWTFDAINKVVIPGALTKADKQKFTLTEIGTSGKVNVKDFSGLFITATTGTGTFTETGAAEGWTITPNTVAGVSGYAFPGENYGLHQGSGGWNWHVAAGWYNLTDNCTFFFYEATADVDLNIAIDDATVRLNTAIVGTGIGQTPQADINTYQNAINTAKTTLGSTNATAIQNAINALATATTTFIYAKIPVVQSSTSTSPVWYLIKNTVRSGKGATLYTNGLNAQMLCTTAANTIAADGTGTGTVAPALKYLFRFEIQTNGSYRIVNAALPAGEALQGASGGSSSSPINYGTATTPPTTWNLNFLGYNTTLAVNEIKFVSTGNGTIFHDAGQNALVSWDAATGSASAWYIEQYTGNVSSLYQTQYDALTTQYNAIADGSGNPVAPYTFGTQPGQYDANKFQTVKTAYAAMVTEAGTNGVTSQNMIQKFTDLSVAIAAFNASKVAPVAYGGTIDLNKTYVLKLVQPGSANDGYFLSNPLTDADATSVRKQATFSQSMATNCEWKFVASATAGKYIICSTLRTNEYLDEEGRVRKDGYADNTWTTKTLLQNTLIYDANSLLIVKIDNNNNYYINGTGSGATLGRNASSWSTFKLEEPTAGAYQTSLQTKITEAQNRLSATIEGTQLLQFSAAARTALQNAISTAQTTLASSDISTLINGISTLTAAIITYNNAAIWPYCAPATGTPGGTNRAITAGTIVANDVTTNLPANLNFLAPTETLIPVKRGQTITITLSANTNTKWGMAYAFFDWNQDNAWALDGVKTGTEDNGGSFTFTPDTNGERYLIGKGDGTTAITNTTLTVTVPTTAALGRTALRIKCDESKWYNNTDPSDPCTKIYFGSVYNYVLNILDNTTGNVNNTANTQYIIRTANRMITVDGIDNFDVFSISGQRINKMQPVQTGIYIVKINNHSFKVNVN